MDIGRDFVHGTQVCLSNLGSRHWRSRPVKDTGKRMFGSGEYVAQGHWSGGSQQRMAEVCPGVPCAQP